MINLKKLFSRKVWATVSRKKATLTMLESGEIKKVTAVLQKNQFDDYRAYSVTSSGERYSADVDFILEHLENSK